MFWVNGRFTTKVDALRDLVARVLAAHHGTNSFGHVHDEPEMAWDEWGRDAETILDGCLREEPGIVYCPEGAGKSKVMEALRCLDGATIKQCGVLEQSEMHAAHGIVLYLVDGRRLRLRVADNRLTVTVGEG
jgi:hypothetical protein